MKSNKNTSYIMNTTYQNLTLEQKLDIISRDFLDRDRDTFVSIREDGRLGWEDRLAEGGAYSGYILNPDSDEQLITNAHRLAVDMIKVMDPPFRVHVRLGDDDSMTDGKVVYVATEMFDDSSLSVGAKLDTFIGLAVHEGCHLLYTDFEVRADAGERLTACMENIIEDERIERICGQKTPGLANFFKSVKYYYFGRYSDELDRTEGIDRNSTFIRLLNTVLQMIRYPAAMKPDDMERFADVLLEIRDVLVPFPSSTRESLDAARRIVAIIEEHMEKSADDSSEKEQDFQQDGQGEGETEAASSGQSEAGDASGDGSDLQGGDGCGEASDVESSDEKESLSNGAGPQDGGSAQPDTDGDASRNDPGSVRPDVREEMEQILSGIASALGQIAPDPATDHVDGARQSRTVKEDDGMAALVCAGIAERGAVGRSFILKGEPDRDVYMGSLYRVRPYIPAISKALRCAASEYKITYRGMRSGILDTGKIAEAFQGVQTVYTRSGEIKAGRLSVCILIDESGSMEYGGEIPARDTAVLLNEALDRIPNVDLYIYGHSTWRHGTELYVYREGRSYMPYALGGTSSRYGNMDSVAITEACARVRRHTDSSTVMFVISDGAPNEGTEPVRMAVRQAERDGFTVVGISISPSYDPAEMYGRNVLLTDMSTLALDLGKIVRKEILARTSRTVVL